jgi:regulator of protease activity HflC (stomatin/prohibitin superfamily)
MDDGLVITLTMLGIIIAVPLTFYVLSKWDRVTISEWEAGLLLRHGKYVRTLSAGRHWIYPPAVTVVRIELRPVTFNLASLNVVTSDGMCVLVSGIATLKVNDPLQAFDSSENFYNHAFFQLQSSVRKHLSAASSARIMQWGREALSEQILRDVNAAILPCGVAFSSFEISELGAPNQVLEQAPMRAN